MAIQVAASGDQTFSCTEIDGATVCEPAIQSVAVAVANNGSLPGRLHLRPRLVDGDCSALTVAVGANQPAALCDVVGAWVDLGLVLDPGTSNSVEVVLGVAPTVPRGAWDLSLDLGLSLGLWVLDDDPSDAWSQTRAVGLLITGVWTDPEPAPAGSGGGTQDAESPEEEAPIVGGGTPVEPVEEEPAAGEDTDPSDEVPPPEGPPAGEEGESTSPIETPEDDGSSDEPVGGDDQAPPGEETAPQDNDAPPGEPPAGEAESPRTTAPPENGATADEPIVEEPVEDDQAPSGEESGSGDDPPPEEPPSEEEPPSDGEAPDDSDTGLHDLTGVVWLDDDGDRLLIPQSGEVGVDGLVVDLLAESGEQLARVRTDETGRYEFVGLPAGFYVIEIHLPPGVGPSDPDPDDRAQLEDLAVEIAGELGIDPAEVVVDDTVEVIAEPDGQRVRSGLLTVGGDPVEAADFALSEEPGDVPAEPAKDPEQVATRPEEGPVVPGTSEEEP